MRGRVRGRGARVEASCKGGRLATTACVCVSHFSILGSVVLFSLSVSLSLVFD